MTTQYAIEGNNITKNLKGFNLDIDDLKVPKGFATALIGENGAGKTTLLNILSGLRLDYKGDITFFGRYSDKEKEDKYKKQDWIYRNWKVLSSAMDSQRH